MPRSDEGPHILQGELDRAFERLENAYPDRSAFMMLIGVVPLMEPLRGDPRFEDLVRRVRLEPRD